MSDKRMIDGYTELASLQLAGRVVILAEKAGADDPYMVVNCKWDNPLGADEYYSAAVSADYLDAMREFIKREATLLAHLEAERSLSGLPVQPMTAADCIPDSMRESLVGKAVLIKPEDLSPEYRSAEHQIAYCTGGHGARPDARGSAVFCKMLHDGAQMRYERRQVAGVVDPAKLPVWARSKLAELEKAPIPKPVTLADQIKAARDDAARHNAEPDDGKRDKGRSPEER